MTITLIVPIYNEESFLRRCLDSIEKQTEPFDEVILIDDNSTDKSLDIATEYAVPNKWQVFENFENMGVAYSRNIGIENATSDFIAFLDADDALVLTASEIMKREAEAGANIIQFNHWRKYELVDELRMKYQENARKFTLADMPTRPLAWFAVWNKVYRRDFLLQKQLFFNEDLEWGEDLLFNAQAIIKNYGLRCAEDATCIRHFDNKQSLNHLNRDSKHEGMLIKKLKQVRHIDERIIGEIIAEHQKKQRESA